MLNYIYNLATDKYKGPIPSFVKALLFILSIIYGLIVRILIFVHRFNKYQAGCRVISIGNITLGGTGKTPLVEYIAKYLKSQGHRVAIVTRGYKRTGYRLSVIGFRPKTEHRTPSTETMGDEPYMLQENLGDTPVIVDADRARAIKKAVNDYIIDTIILDDGFQQWKIKKDLEIVTIDCANPFGNRHMLPRGILREPLSSLKRADVFVLTKVNLSSNAECIKSNGVFLGHPNGALKRCCNRDIQNIKYFLNRINPSALVIESLHCPYGFYKFGRNDYFLGTEAFKGKTVTLFSGIGSPGSFENLISSLEINIGLSFRFKDHYRYAQKDLDNIIDESQKKNIDAIITTEKDAIRLKYLPPAVFRLPIFVLRIELKIISDEERFYNRLLGLYSI